MYKTPLALALVLCALGSPLSATANPNPTHIPHHPRVDEVNRRIADQHGRIVAGDKNGSLSGAEQHRLDAEYARVKRQEHRMRAADGGHLTRQDRRILNRELDRRSHEIYVDKHN